jgi:hypothetical protein
MHNDVALLNMASYFLANLLGLSIISDRVLF